MPLRLLIAVFLIASLRVDCQQAANAPITSALPKDARAFFEAAVPHYDFSDPTLKPWHLKAHYQIYDFEGKLATEGTWEYWWASPKVRRRSWERPGLSRTEWITEDGTIFRKTSGEFPHYFERSLEHLILDSGPEYELVKAGRLKLGFKESGGGATGPTCLSSAIEASKSKPSRAQHPEPDFYCYDPGTMALLRSYSDAYSIVSNFNTFAVMQNHYIARHVTAQVGRTVMLIVSVESVNWISATDPALLHEANAVPIPERACYTPECRQTVVHLTGGELLNNISPELHSWDVHGTVSLIVQVGTDGKVNTADVLSSPSARLAQTITDAVKQYRYKPYIADGKPIKMDIPFSMSYF